MLDKRNEGSSNRKILERKNRVKKIEDNNCSLLMHFWSTFRSPFCTCYIPFQSLGSQESNASSGVQFGVEMNKLQPLQDDHSKLKEAFCKVLRNQPFVARISQPFCTVLWISLEVSHRDGSQTPQDESQLRSGAEPAFCCEVISQPS